MTRSKDDLLKKCLEALKECRVSEFSLVNLRELRNEVRNSISAPIERCSWRINGSLFEEGIWDSGCGQDIALAEDRDLKKIRFCPFCGKLVEVLNK